MEWNLLQKLVESYSCWRSVSLVTLRSNWIYLEYFFYFLSLPDLSLIRFIQFIMQI